MIKAVLFDYGGVLTEGGKAGAIRQIFAAAYGIGPNDLQFESSGMEAIKGLITDDDFLTIMNDRHAKDQLATREQFIAAVDDLVPCQPVYELAASLRDHGVRTAIASNILTVAGNELRGRGRYDDFDPVLLSCEVHAAKPEPEFYAIALERLGLEPHEVLFIDDQERFLEPARQIGMQTLLASSPEQIVADVKAVIQKENNLTLE